MQSPVESPTLKQAARRKLVRGVFAAPAVLTVCSGSAFANSSSMRCLVNQTATGNQVTMPVIDGTDAWLRIQLYQTGTSPSFSYWISGNFMQTWKRPTNSVYLTSTQWQAFNIGTTTPGAIQGSMPSGAQTCNKYAVLRFNAAGNVVGVGTSGTASSALAGTCWASFYPGL